MEIRATLLSMAIAAALTNSEAVMAAPLALDESPPPIQQVQQSNAWLEVNLGQFKDNMDQFRKHLSQNTKICFVMKADAYGNGIQGLMPTVLEMKVPCIAIASNAEARAVREAGFDGQLIRVRSADIHEIKEVMDLDVEELIGSVDQANHIMALEKDRPIKVHLALTTVVCLETALI